ncbi:MAG: polysaccharide deacetylase family protein [Akkermansiaceae bacterium]|nr:polysaccharide deacetylase family protein [Akkermansiaceae bacterium]MCF7732132.1 polysaccharide deacetylase family protein [Akkermansiaceae bacterium]
MIRLLTILALTTLSAIAEGPAATPVSPAPAGQPGADAPPAPREVAVPEPAASTADSSRVAVLGYHEFSETSQETAMRIHTSKFRNQMATLRQLGITVISLDDFLAWRRGEKTIPEKCALITMDDGWRSVYSDAYPILKEFGYPFTLYLYKNYIDGGGRALTTPMIQEMLKDGATLGSHSVSHPYPAIVKAQRRKGPHQLDAFLRKEVGESKRFIEAKFATKVTTFAYPGGYVTEEMLPLAQEFGYSSLFTVLPGKISQDTDAQRLPRYMILGNYDKIYEIATTFSQAGPAAPAGTITGLTQVTPYPVTPEPGAVINSRLPVISTDLSTLAGLDPATLTMQVSGFGQVPATFDPVTKQFAWQVNRRLRQPFCQITVNWLDAAGNKPDVPLCWTFQLDCTAAYLPEGK